MNLFEIIVIIETIIILAGMIWARWMILKAKRELILTKEELNFSMKTIETEILKIKKEMTKHSNYHERLDSKNLDD
ncbi:MAG TPA: hypothetical protein PK990_00455 [Salinivirgaceae bacterium]|nr:hypothetical protein [Salinivirgaceae bacterium]